MRPGLRRFGAMPTSRETKASRVGLRFTLVSLCVLVLSTPAFSLVGGSVDGGVRRRRSGVTFQEQGRHWNPPSPGNVAQDAVIQDAFFRPWADWLDDHFREEFDLELEQLPEGLDVGHGTTPAGDGAVAHTSVYTSRRSEDQDAGPIRRLRISIFAQGSKLQALNAVVYPAYSLGPLPILCVDILSFSDHQRQLFATDWAPLQIGAAYADAHIAPFLGQDMLGYQELATIPGTRIYGEEPEFFSPHMFFSRPVGSALLTPGAALWEVFQDYVEKYSAMLHSAQPPLTLDVSEVEQRQADYDQWHSQRDPAVPLLGRLFGRQWADDFFKEVAFPGMESASQRQERKLVHV